MPVLRPDARLASHPLWRSEQEESVCRSRKSPAKTDRILSAVGEICSKHRVVHQISLGSSGMQFWYEDCFRFYMSIAMKQPMINLDADQNWSWPEKTWFQERLNAIKAREQELRRKPLVTMHKPATMMAEPHEKKEPVKVELSPKS
jgi:hypothetical protein